MPHNGRFPLERRKVNIVPIHKKSDKHIRKQWKAKSHFIFQCLFWVDIRAGVSQGFILRPLLCLIYINGLSNDIQSKCELFADDTSLFFVVPGTDTSAYDLNQDLED